MTESNSKKKGYILLYDSRVHRAEEGMIWSQNQEVARSHLICTQEKETGRTASVWGYEIPEPIPSDALVQQLLYFLKVS